MRGLFVTGTGTEVGKTVVASAIANTARAVGNRVAVFKPAVSGLDDHPLRSEVWESASVLPTTIRSAPVAINESGPS